MPNHENLQKELEKKLKKRAKRKKRKMKVSGKKIYELKKIITQQEKM